MITEFRQAVVPKELRSLAAFDHKVFKKPDWFPLGAWREYESWWMIVNRTKVGCCAFEHHVDFLEDIGEANSRREGSLYISSTGIAPRFHGMGFGTLLKAWQVAYARHHRFTRIVTNMRESNLAIIRLNQNFNFKVIRTTPGYYGDPREPTVVMACQVSSAAR
jgi:ribosomal protein S18 acetylase RimI-like enzyme